MLILIYEHESLADALDYCTRARAYYYCVAKIRSRVISEAYLCVYKARLLNGCFILHMLTQYIRSIYILDGC